VRKPNYKGKLIFWDRKETIHGKKKEKNRVKSSGGR
jgi:hypothetical protein